MVAHFWVFVGIMDDNVGIHFATIIIIINIIFGNAGCAMEQPHRVTYRNVNDFIDFQ